MNWEMQLQSYQPWNQQEQQDRLAMLDYLHLHKDLWGRALPAHFTASSWVVSPDRSQVLLAYHRIYDAWSWLGGHADGEQDLLAVAMRETKEESGLTQVRPVTPDIYSLEILCVNGHVKKGIYVPSHLHLNLTYLLEAQPDAPIHCRPEENSAVRWFSREQASQASSESWMRCWIYDKLNDKLKNF